MNEAAIRKARIAVRAQKKKLTVRDEKVYKPKSISRHIARRKKISIYNKTE